MAHEWTQALIFLLLATGVAGTMLLGAWLLRARPAARSPLTGRTYESGEEAYGSAWIQFHPRFYVVALLFVLFDLEAVFLLPWALVIRELGLGAIVEMFLFVAVLMTGWWYALARKALRWQ